MILSTMGFSIQNMNIKTDKKKASLKRSCIMGSTYLIFGVSVHSFVELLTTMNYIAGLSSNHQFSASWVPGL